MAGPLTPIVGLQSTFLEPTNPVQVPPPATSLGFLPVARRAIPRAFLALHPRTVSTAAFAAAPLITVSRPKPRVALTLRRRQSILQPADLGMAWAAQRPKRTIPQLRRSRGPFSPPPPPVVQPLLWAPTLRRSVPRWLERTRPSQPCPWAQPTVAVFPIVLAPRRPRKQWPPSLRSRAIRLPEIPPSVVAIRSSRRRSPPEARRRCVAVFGDRLPLVAPSRPRQGRLPRRRIATVSPPFAQVLPPVFIPPQRGRKAPSCRRIVRSQYGAWTPGGALPPSTALRYYVDDIEPTRALASAEPAAAIDNLEPANALVSAESPTTLVDTESDPNLSTNVRGQ